MTAVVERKRPVAAPPRGSWPAQLVGLVLLVAACWAAVATALPTPAPDPVLVSTTPADHALADADEEVRLVFDRAVPTALVTVRMTGPSGAELVTGRPYRPSGAGADTVAVAMPETRYEGTYSVAWSVPTSDWKTVEGTFAFHIYYAPEPLALPVLRAAPQPVLTGLLVAGWAAAVVGFVGLVAVALRVAVAGPVGRSRRLLIAAWWTTAGGTLLTLLTYGGYAARTSFWGAFDPALVPGTLASEVGGELRARLLGLVVAAVAVAMLLRSRPADRLDGWLRAGGVLLAAAALAMTWPTAMPHEPLGPSAPVLAAEAGSLLAAAVVVSVVAAFGRRLRARRRERP
jgi:copper transport protein